jgi:hypothetical protein
MDWHKVSGGPYSGKTLPEIMFQVEDPHYVLDGLETGRFSGPMRDEAAELCRRAAHIRVPRGEGEDQDVVVYYNVNPDGRYRGLAIVPKSNPKLAEYERSSAAHTNGYVDLTVLRRIAPGDKQGTLRLIHAFDYLCLGERMTLGQFFDDPENFLH